MADFSLTADGEQRSGRGQSLQLSKQPALMTFMHARIYHKEWPARGLGESGGGGRDREGEAEFSPPLSLSVARLYYCYLQISSDRAASLLKLPNATSRVRIRKLVIYSLVHHPFSP